MGEGRRGELRVLLLLFTVVKGEKKFSSVARNSIFAHNTKFWLLSSATIILFTPQSEMI